MTEEKKYRIYMNIQEMACFLDLMSHITVKQNKQLIDNKDALQGIHEQIFTLWDREMSDQDEPAVTDK